MPPAAITGTFTPYFAQVSVGTSSAGQDLFTLMSGVFSQIQHKACFINIQADQSNAGASINVGNSNVTTSMYGSQLVAAAALALHSYDSNLLVLDHIFLLSTSGTIKANITVVTR